MSASTLRLLVGFLGCLSLGLTGWLLRHWTLDGAVVLALLSGVIFRAGGWTWGLLAALILAGQLFWDWRDRSGDGTARNGRDVLTAWGVPALAALLYARSAHSAAWAAFIGAAAFAAADSVISTHSSPPWSGLALGALTGGAMLVLHDLAALRRGLPTGWIDLWLVPIGAVGGVSGVAVREWARGRWGPRLARLVGSVLAGGVAGLVGQVGWQLLGPIL